MALRLYNTLTRAKEDFAPIDPANVRLYVCGPTVYDFAHIGNARPVIVFDVLFRLLRHVYGADHVTYVRNITDVDDKINARAAEEYPGLPLNEAIRRVTEKTEAQYHADVDALGCLRPTVEPRATEFVRRDDGMTDMIGLIERLIASGHAYAAEGHVLFDVKSWRGGEGSSLYGRLSRRSLDDMIAGARVEVAPYKKDPMDFVLWKPSSASEPGWDSPWGRGRPGWHIECSAMSAAYLGETFDIHGGGIDLVFPHHENEIAQSCCAFGTERMANVWMHNGFLQVEGEKMSKSLGNFVTIRELLQEWPGPALRLAMLHTHYRQPINWTRAGVQSALSELERWVGLVFDTNLLGRLEVDRLAQRLPPLDERVLEPLTDDLNFPGALAGLRELADEAKSEVAMSGWSKQYDLLRALSFLGLVDPTKIGALENGVRGSVPIAVMTRHAALFARVRTAVANSDEAEIEEINRRLAAEGLRFDIEPSHGDVSLVRIVAGPHAGDDSVERLIAARAAARAAKNWAEADRIRDELAAMGIALKDAKDPATGELVTTWEVAR